MLTLQNARARVVAILDEIERLKESEFPYDFPLDALNLLERKFKRFQDVLAKTSADSELLVVNNVCRDSLREIQTYVPVLGFLLRATNVRNAFESHGAFQRLAENLMGEDTKLVISSEWEFSPFVYRPIDGLTGFVLIGLPAPESSNPLLLPLAGHELGHSIWGHAQLSQNYQDQVNQKIVHEITESKWEEYSALYPQYSQDDVRGDDLYAPDTIRPAYTWAMLQIEEMFCDFFGLRVFDESYLHAFAYLLSPGTSVQRSFAYPNIKRRVSHLVQASKKLGIDVPDEYENIFIEETEPFDPTAALLVSVADTVSSSLVEELIDNADKIANDNHVPKRDATKVADMCDLFGKWVVPAKDKSSLIDIVNAGWKCYMDGDLWKDVPQIKGRKEEEFLKNRERVLRDIMLKSLEISEICERLEDSS